MPRSPQLLVSALAFLFSCVITACGRDPVAVPAVSEEGVPRSDTRAEYAYVQEQISALKSLLATDGGLDQLRSRGTDTTLINERRQRAEAQLASMQGLLAELASGTIRGSPLDAAMQGGEEEVEAPACFLNWSLEGCFLLYYSTIDHRGSGTVYQWASTIFKHSTSTDITDNGTPLGAPRTTSSLFMVPVHTANYTFSPPDPNCQSGDHEIIGETNHRIKLRIRGVGEVAAQKSSRDHSVCYRKYLTVSLSASAITVGSIANITVGRLPSGGCAYWVTSSNTEIASVTEYGPGIWGAMGLSPGTVTITANCKDGGSGSATLTVTGACTPPDTSTTVARSCVPLTTPPGSGGGSESPLKTPEPDCHWERDFGYWPDGKWMWLGDWRYVCDGQVMMSTVASNQAAANRLRLRLIGTGSLPNGRSVTVTRSHDAGVAATIVIDTAQATAADLEQAFAAAQLLSGSSVDFPVDVGAIVSRATEAARAKHGPTSRAARFLKALGRAAAMSEVRPFGSGRSIEVEINVRTLRVNP